MEELYRKYHKEVYLYAYSLCKDHHNAQDLTSNTFFKAYLSIDDVSYIKYWLFRVCRNLYLDSIRKQREYSREDISGKVQSSEVDILDQIIETDEKRQIYDLVIRLSDSYREILILYYYCGFSVKDISSNHSISESSVKTTLYRARKKLRRELEEGNGL
ncbi:RNA polymerase sigma factor [Proteiniclasticum sp. SCR006]|uniref:RNA polymerase sigma factor n=1 Tax=Proteiniclasticum aestuarii TaxID=2817862 RepID=A0A939KKA5_9CLOT|nr:RNA polymerase sigma factor [Proteiniclasticum aestuarii]MBO1265891.1 RNA polymerase sigma factor [Proteiniclasticum aestuarii]